MGDFEQQTRVEDLGEGRYRAILDRDWEIWGPNGGYLATIALRAAGSEAAIARPASFGCHFLRVANFAEVDIEVVVLRRGRRAESLRVSVSQEGRPVLEGWLRTAAEGAGLEHDYTELPDVPPAHELTGLDELLPANAPSFRFWQNLEARPTDPGLVGDPATRVAAPPVFREWLRFRPRATFDDVWVDAGRLVVIVDTLTWPAAVRPHPRSGYIAPNLDLSVWFHRFDQASEWLLADHAAPLAVAGMIGAHGRVWSDSGSLLASGGAQLLCAPTQTP